MKITLDQVEITEAVKTYVRSMIALSADSEIKIDFTMGRNENGLSATLDITPPRLPAPKPEPVYRNTPSIENDPVSAPGMGASAENLSVSTPKIGAAKVTSTKDETPLETSVEAKPEEGPEEKVEEPTIAERSTLVVPPRGRSIFSNAAG
jgi:hypothetical protein